jgi:transketolase
LKDNGLEALTSDYPDRFQYRADGGAYLNLRGLPLEALREIDEVAIAKLRWIVRGLQFAMADGADSGHVGGSSSKTEQILALLTSGVLAFDPLHPKHPGRDRLAWSAGHTTPLFHGVVALIYECLRRKGVALSDCAMSQDTLPGGFRPMTAFATYGVFTCMMANAVRVTLINSDVNPSAAAFFIMLAAHDGPETGEDGPTHHGLFWMSLYSAYPGISLQAAGRQRSGGNAVSGGAARRTRSVLVHAARHPGLEARRRRAPGARGHPRRLRFQTVSRKRKAQESAGDQRRAGDAQHAPDPAGD